MSKVQDIMVKDGKEKTDEELFELIRKYLDDGCGELWDRLIPEERRKVFPQLILEYLETTR